MTADERKRGLKAAVDAKMIQLLDAVGHAANFYAYHWYADSTDKIGSAVVDKALTDMEKYPPGGQGGVWMTAYERKRGLRAAVKTKITEAAKGVVLGGLSNYSDALLWEIIDSLVDECAETNQRLAASEECSEARRIALDEGNLHPVDKEG